MVDVRGNVFTAATLPQSTCVSTLWAFLLFLTFILVPELAVFIDCVTPCGTFRCIRLQGISKSLILGLCQSKKPPLPWV